MSAQRRMPRYDVRNDGIGPYAVFYCDVCSREFRSQPDVTGTITQDLGRQAVGGLLRGIPLVGGAVASSMHRQDPRYSTSLTPQQVETAWKQVEPNLHLCPTCQRFSCPSDWDAKSGFCSDDSPRREELAEAQAAQATGVMKGIASAFGLGEALRGMGEAVKSAAANTARCPKDGTLAPAGAKFCPNCGGAMVQPASDACPKCGAETAGAKFCPQCGARIERASAATKCPKCGAEVKGAKFCPECGAKIEAAPAAPTKCASCGAELKGAKFCPECGAKAG